MLLYSNSYAIGAQSSPSASLDNLPEHSKTFPIQALLAWEEQLLPLPKQNDEIIQTEKYSLSLLAFGNQTDNLCALMVDLWRQTRT